jgi:hypothetical protein
MQNTHESYVKNIQKCLKNQQKIQQIQKRNYIKLTNKYNMDLLNRIGSIKNTAKYLKNLNKEFNKLKASNKSELSSFLTLDDKNIERTSCSINSDRASELFDGHFTHSSYYFNSNQMLFNSSSQFGITVRKKRFEENFILQQNKRGKVMKGMKLGKSQKKTTKW